MRCYNFLQNSLQVFHGRKISMASGSPEGGVHPRMPPQRAAVRRGMRRPAAEKTAGM
jgi:hypothetical protein